MVHILLQVAQSEICNQKKRRHQPAR
jgi:hypothetical protein